MKERFEGANRSQLIAALKLHTCVQGNTGLAKQFASKGTVVEFKRNEDVISQHGPDTDVYLLLLGSVSVLVNGASIARRGPGEHVGEMAAMLPSQPRSATVRALETVVALKVSGPAFMEIGRVSQEVWLPVARELAKRLYERNKTILVPNPKPKVFIISSGEAKPIAHAIRDNLAKDKTMDVTVWDKDVFFAGGYALQALEIQLQEADFAVAVAEADDVTTSRKKKNKTVRDNVIFELGLFMGKLTRYRAVLAHPKIAKLKLPSDLDGLTVIRYKHGAPSTAAKRVASACTQLRELVQKAGSRKFTFETDRSS